MYYQIIIKPKGMKFLLIISLILLGFAGSTFSYPESQMGECISNALNNPATKSIPQNKLKKYCHCALTSIFDENKDIRESGYECALISFN